MRPDGQPERDKRRNAAERGSVRRILLISIGVVSVILGTAGIFIPLLPTTPFLLLAGACFTRSSDRLHTWLMHHRWFGTYIRNYQEHRAITLPTKVLAIALLWTTMTYTALVVVGSWWVRGPLLALAVGVTIHLLKLRTLRKSAAPESSRQAYVDAESGTGAGGESGPCTSPDGA